MLSTWLVARLPNWVERVNAPIKERRQAIQKLGTIDGTDSFFYPSW
jgi:hypothetical protein